MPKLGFKPESSSHQVEHSFYYVALCEGRREAYTYTLQVLHKYPVELEEENYFNMTNKETNAREAFPDHLT